MPEITGVSTALSDRLIPADGLLVSMAEHFDEFLMDWQMKHPMVFRDRIPMGKFPLYSGYSQKSYIFRGTLGPQAGLTEWSDIEPSRKPAGADLGYDRCTYNPSTYTWAFDMIDFSGLSTSWRSPVFCVNDLKFQDKAAAQLSMIVQAGAQITDQVKETFNREQYVKTAADAGKFVALVDGLGVSFIDSADCRVSYNPRTADADGDTYVEFDATLLPKLSTLNWTSLDLIRQYMADQCPDAAQGSDSGMPIFGLMLDIMDFERFVLADDKLREDFRYAKPQQLISGFNMGFKVYRGYMLMHDVRQMRFRPSTITADATPQAHCKRVLPRRATRAGMIGLVPESNPAYVEAQLGTAILFLNQAIQVLVPDPVNRLSEGMTFGPAPDFNGQWAWVNYKSDNNPLGEVGYFFSRFEYFTKMLRYAQEALVILYRRCTQSIATGCAADVVTSAVNEANLARAAVEADLDTTNRTMVVELASRLAAGLGDAVSVTKDDGNAFAANIIDDSASPTYTVAWLSGATNAPAAYTEMADITISKVTVA